VAPPLHNPEAQVERAKQALGRWSQFGEDPRAPRETLTVVADVVLNLQDDTKAVRATVIGMSRELKTLRVRVDALERQLALFTEEPTTQPPFEPYARHPPPTPVEPFEPDIPMAEPEEVFVDVAKEVRSKWKELSNLLELTFPEEKGPPR
jgi:hypothetical protein